MQPYGVCFDQKPYVRQTDDQLALLSQCEILLILMMGHILRYETDTHGGSDVLLLCVDVVVCTGKIMQRAWT